MKGLKRLILPAVFLIFAAYLVYSTLQLDRFTCRVCMEFQGQQACRTASGATREDAERAAKDNACAQLTSGMSNSRACAAQAPLSIEWLEVQD